MIAGRDAPTHGEAKNSWLTGTAAWNYVAITQWILGIRPELDGLRIDPVIPSSLAGLHRHPALPRRDLPDHRPPGGTLDSGLAEGAGVRVNGQRIAGTLLPLAPAGETVQVEVILPASAP